MYIRLIPVMLLFMYNHISLYRVIFKTQVANSIAYIAFTTNFVVLPCLSAVHRSWLPPVCDTGDAWLPVQQESGSAEP